MSEGNGAAQRPTKEEETRAKLGECMGRWKHSWQWVRLAERKRCTTCGLEVDVKRFEGQ